MRIHLIRHGETASNFERIVQTPDTPLNERGRLQARRVAGRLAESGIGLVLTSDHQRALETAETIAGDSLPLEVEPLLQERSFGDLRGRTYAAIGFDIFAPGYTPPGGESWEAFHARVDRAWDRVLERAASFGGGELVVVTHGLVCRSLAERRLTLPAGVPPPLQWGNTSLTRIVARPPFEVEVLNCVAHLGDEDADRTETSGM